MTPFEFQPDAIRKEPAGRPVRYDLISPQGLRAWAEACAEGQQNYGGLSYEQTDRPLLQSNLLNHAIAHLYAYLAGDRSENHLGHALWNVGIAAENEVRHRRALNLPQRAVNDLLLIQATEGAPV